MVTLPWLCDVTRTLMNVVVDEADAAAALSAVSGLGVDDEVLDDAEDV